jgi:hypothetical protein
VENSLKRERVEALRQVQKLLQELAASGKNDENGSSADGEKCTDSRDVSKNDDKLDIKDEGKDIKDKSQVSDQCSFADDRF